MKIMTSILATILMAVPSLAAVNGKALFEAKCASCHAKDGSAATTVGKAVGAKDLRVTKLTDEQIATQIHDGKGNMPAFADLGKDEVNALVAYVRVLGQKSPVKTKKK